MVFVDLRNRLKFPYDEKEFLSGQFTIIKNKDKLIFI